MPPPAGRKAFLGPRFRASLALLPAALALFAGSAVPTLAHAAVPVRIGIHRTYTRLVFDFRRPIKFHVESGHGAAVIALAAPVHLDLPRLAAAKPRLVGAHVVNTGGKTVVHLALAKGVTVRYFEENVHLVVDAMDPLRTAQATKSATPAREKVAPRKAALKRSHEEARHDNPQPARKRTTAAIKSPTLAKALAPAGATAPPTRIIPPSSAAAPAPSPASLHVGVAMSANRLQLSFPWPEPVDAAVFERAGWLWIVFDHAARLDIAALAQHGMPIVWRAAQLANAKAAILRMRVGPGRTPIVSGNDTDWQVALVSASAAAPPRSIPVQIEPSAPPSPQVFLAVPEAGQLLTVTDPAVGDQLTVITVGKPGLGLAAPRSFAQFSLLSAAQGVAVAKTSDRLSVAAAPAGVAITATGGLLLSEASTVSRTNQPRPDAMLHLGPTWAGPPGHYEATKQRLQFGLVQAPTGGLTEARYALAEFFFANGLDAEAEGVLDRLVAQRPAAATRPRFELLHGAVLFGLRRFSDAENELAKPNIAGRPEAALWFGAAKAAQRDWKEALPYLERGRSVLLAYPPTIRARFELAIAHAQLGTGEPAGAQATLVRLRKDDPDAATKAESYFLSGVAAQRVGKAAEARVFYQKAEASKIAFVHVRGKMALALVALAQKRIAKAAAIKQLEALRYAWRGGAFEDQLLQHLGGLYLSQSRFREALTTWNTVVTYFPDYPNTPVIKKRMQDVFLQLFLHGGADKLSALKAIGLFYDFRDLTPNNASGDAIVRRLARRLVSVDLLSQAEDLLHYQITYRLANGPEKAKVGAHLAKIYLLDQQPKMAVAALAESDATPLSATLVEQRRNLKVAALIELERYGGALEALAGATDNAAVTLRAGIYWRARNWPEEATILTRILGSRYAVHKPLTTEEQLDVLRLAVAFALSGNNAGLTQLRQEYSPLFVGTDQAEAFRAVTEKIGLGNGLPSSNFFANLDQLQGFLARYNGLSQKAG